MAITINGYASLFAIHIQITLLIPYNNMRNHLKLLIRILMPKQTY